jgi:lysine-specific permease
LSGFIAWLGIAVSHYCFRKAYVAQGKDLSKLPYKAKWYPLGPILALNLCIIAVLGQNNTAFLGPKIDWNGILVSYIGLPLFILVWLSYKWIVKSKVIPLDKCSFDLEDK